MSTQTPNKPTQTPSVSLFRQLTTVLGTAVIVATIFTAWTPIGLIADTLAGKVPSSNPNPAQYLQPDQENYPTPTPRPRPRIGIVSGHWGNDAGAVCTDGLTEAQINLTVATLVKQQLVEAGFDVDLLEEFDFRLTGYRGLALVSIHSDSCDYINDQATGYKVAAALSTANRDRANRLTACLRNRYTEHTGLSFHSGSITADMTSYHAFEEIHNETTAAIIEIGFLNLDRQILTQYPETVAQGITDGVLCFIYNEDVNR